MTKLSVNINKIAVLRNSRGGAVPDVVQAAADCERFGAEGITVHPRPDERHIRYADVRQIAPCITTELNMEGYPSARFMELALEVKPAQATLVPDEPNALTSSAGWDTLQNKAFLKGIVARLHGAGIRTSIFVAADAEMVKSAAETGTDRIELYTEPYAANYLANAEQSAAPFATAAQEALSLGMQVNAGHDLNLANLRYFVQNVPKVSEVSIGHALICDALYYGLENTIQMYIRQLR